MRRQYGNLKDSSDSRPLKVKLVRVFVTSRLKPFSSIILAVSLKYVFREVT